MSAGDIPAKVGAKPWQEPNKTRSWFEPSSSSYSSASVPNLSISRKGSWNENPLQDSLAPAPITFKKIWQENPLRDNTQFTSLSQQIAAARPPSPTREKRKSIPFLPPTIVTPLPSPGPSPSPSPSPSSSASSSPLPVYEDLFGVTNGIFSRPLSKLSVSKDLPRFSPHIQIYKSHELLLRPTNDEGTASHIMDIKNILLTLLVNLDPPELVQAFQDNFSKYVTAELDIATRLQAFFQSGVLPETCNTFAVLRCIHQEIIFPAVMKLRQSVYELYPYKDVKGSWNIYVVLMDNHEVRIIHTKKEQSHDPNPSAHFGLEWVMAITLSPSTDEDPLSLSDDASNSSNISSNTCTLNTNNNTNKNTNTNNNNNSSNNNNNNKGALSVNNGLMALQNVDFWVIDSWLDDGFDKNAKPLLLKLLRKLFHPNTATMCLWSKQDLFQVNVPRDFPRLAIKTTITDIDKKLVLFSPAAESEKDPSLQILMTLTERLNPEHMVEIKKAYDTHVERPGDKIEFSVKFTNFLQSLVAEKVVADDCLLFKVLKCITNDIIYPSVMTLREQIYGDFPYKDVRNSRKVMIDISNRKNQVKISHVKSEQTNDSSVEFEWQATFTISKVGSKNLFGLLWYLKQGTYSSVKSHLQITRFILSENIPNSLKIRFRELVHSLAAGRAEKQGVPIPALDFLQSILQSVEAGVYADIPIRLPKIAKAVPLQMALHYLSNALAKVPFELPPVVVPKNRADSVDVSLAKKKDITLEWRG